MATSPIVLRSQAGIKRDGTKFDGEFYTRLIAVVRFRVAECEIRDDPVDEKEVISIFNFNRA